MLFLKILLEQTLNIKEAMIKILSNGHTADIHVRSKGYFAHHPNHELNESKLLTAQHNPCTSKPDSAAFFDKLVKELRMDEFCKRRAYSISL